MENILEQLPRKAKDKHKETIKFFKKLKKEPPKHLKMKEQRFIETYLEVGSDNEFSFKTVPCVFLGFDNECSIYGVRPKACSEYPHTKRR